MFDHMAFDHNFSVGQPDNLVYINELLDLLEGKLDNVVSVTKTPYFGIKAGFKRLAAIQWGSQYRAFPILFTKDGDIEQ